MIITFKGPFIASSKTNVWDPSGNITLRKSKIHI